MKILVPVSCIEQLRSKYRRIHKELSNYTTKKDFFEIIASIKHRIKAANIRKIAIRQSQKEADMEKKTSERKIEVQN